MGAELWRDGRLKATYKDGRARFAAYLDDYAFLAYGLLAVAVIVVFVCFGPGHINLIEDTTGKGHMTRNFGPEDRIVLTVPLADGVVIEGKRTPRTK